MRSWLAFALLITALVIPATAAAAYLNEGQQGLEECKDISGVTVWHFVNNQYNGANPANARLFVEFSTGNVGPLAPSKWNNGTIHWTFETATGAVLEDAWTVLNGTTTQVPGRLVLSDCYKK